MAEGAFEVEYHDMRVGGVPGRHVVAKVGRVSSPPVAADAVPDPRASALRRLADVLRGGTRTRAYADFAAFKRRCETEFANPHWQTDDRLPHP